jgi:hypothetical protein
VESHVRRVVAKLGVRGRVQAADLAYETGLLRPGIDHSREDPERGQIVISDCSLVE